MATERSTTPKIRGHDVAWLKYSDRLTPLLERVHDEDYRRDFASNRRLFYDQYCLLILLCLLFNPLVAVRPSIQQVREL